MDEIKLFKSYQSELVEGERADVSVFTEEICDDEGDVVLSDGVEWDVFEKLGKPIMLSHGTEPSELIGKALWVKQTGKKWLGKSQYKEAYFPLLKEFKGKSISGIITQKRVADDKDKAQWGDRTKRIIEKVSIRETSVCVIPVNPKAVQLALSKGLKVSESILSALGYAAPIDEDRVAKAIKIINTLDYDSIANRAVRRVLGLDV